MNMHVPLQVGRRRQPLLTHPAVQLRAVLMHTPVLAQIPRRRERFTAVRAVVRLLLRVLHLPTNQISVELY